MLRTLVGPLLTLATLAAAILIGGALNSADVSGRVVDDWKDTPIAGADVRFASRTTTTDDDGNFVLGPVPREAKIAAVKRGYGAVTFTPDQHEVRLQPAALSVQVNDSQTGSGVPNPEARKDDQRIGKAPPDGSQFVIAPHPGRDVPFVVCAKDHASKQASSDASTLTLTLDPQKGADCPPLPGATPTPSPTPTPTPTGTGAPSPSPTR